MISGCISVLILVRWHTCDMGAMLFSNNMIYHSVGLQVEIKKMQIRLILSHLEFFLRNKYFFSNLQWAPGDTLMKLGIKKSKDSLLGMQYLMLRNPVN